MCITPACNNMATEIDYRVDPTKNNNGKYPCYCICCMKGHTLLRTEYSNCFTNVECAIMRNIVVTSATSVMYFLPSLAVNFSCPILSDTSLPSLFSLALRSFQYFRGRSVPVSKAITSMLVVVCMRRGLRMQ